MDTKNYAKRHRKQKEVNKGIMKKYIVFGDTGGHFRQLHKALLEIGMTEDYFLPKDIHIIHLGDLVHKGLYSSDILRMIDEVRSLNPGQWTQMIGNHEAQYLGGYVFWEKRVDEPGRKILTKWYNEGFLKFVHVISPLNNNNNNVNVQNNSRNVLTMKTLNKDYSTNKPIVFSHAGISFPFWEDYLMNYYVKDFDKVVEDLNFQQIHQPGIMLGEKFDAYSPVGPVWAHGVDEVWLLWKAIINQIPVQAHFNQIVGHIAPYMYERKMFYPGTHENFKKVAELNENEHLTIAPLNEDKNNKNNNTWMGFMDPGYSKNAGTEVQPYSTIVHE